MTTPRGLKPDLRCKAKGGLVNSTKWLGYRSTQGQLMPLCLHHHPAALFSWYEPVRNVKSFPINEHQCKSYNLYHQLTAGKVDSNFFLFGGMTQSTICSSTLQMGDFANGIRLAFVYHRCTIRSHALTQHLVSKVGMFGSLRAITYCACVYTQTSYFTNRSGKFHSSAV